MIESINSGNKWKLKNALSKLRDNGLARSDKFRVKEVDLADLKSESDHTLFASIFDGELDILVIENFISTDELSYFESAFPKMLVAHPELVDQKATGYTFGKTLFDRENMDDYFSAVQTYEELETKMFSFSFRQRLKELIEKISGLNKVAEAVDGLNRRYLSSTVRMFDPYKGGLTLHSDFHIHAISDESEELMKSLHSSTLLSFYSVLQKPKNGGRLFLFDACHSDTADMNGSYDDLMKAVRKYPVSVYDAPQGSLLLFNAGQRWHNIEQVRGQYPRVSVGCFASYTKDKKEIMIWS